MNEECDKLTPSLRLLLDESGYIDDIVVRDYLHLLRDQCPSNIIIANPRELETPLQLTAPKDGTVDILPFHRDRHWMFAVVRSNCIHWFDSRPHSSTPKELTSPIPVSCWTGPKQSQGQDHDSGLFMLLGIRRIASGYPPINDVQASRMVPHFRSTVFVGLLAKKLMPDEKEQQELGIDFSEGFFRDHGTRPPDSAMSDTPMSDMATGHRAITPLDVLIPRAPMSDSPTQNNSIRPAPRTPLPTTRSRTTSCGSTSSSIHDVLQHRRCILEILCGAVKACRNFKPGNNPGISLLWDIVNGSMKLSTLHRRYYGVRFYREFAASKRSLKWSIGPKEFERMEKAQSKLRFWAELYECHKDLGAGIASTLLCAFSDDHENTSQAKQAEVIGITRARLNNREDTTLWSDLKKAERLCSAVLHCSLSDELLVIEGYSSWKVADLNDAVYKAFVSTDPHVKLPIEPYISR
ncbi:hypothetical protein V8F06_013607 [Rhypophila decipiens]